ncbi:ester cyclase [Kocuria nitroreducens]|uniref:ester cyclase n=1 Tax=Kocuria nitroreducens TaxID=3058914 RepID=UPI0036D7E4C1
MSTSEAEEHREVITQWAASFNAHDAVGVAALYGEDTCVVHPAYRQPLRGRKPVQDDARAFMIALPDVSGELSRVVVGQDCAAAQVTISGVHAGPLVLATGTRPPTGRRLRFTVALFCRFGPEGEIVEEHRYYDVDDIRRQLGDGEHRR